MYRNHHRHGGLDEACRSRQAWGSWDNSGMRHGRRERSERVFETGDLKLLLLALIAEKPAHGYELIKAVEDKTGGVYSPSPGVVYPTLTLLEEIGQVAVEAQEGGKKLYRITEAGSAYLAERESHLKAVFARMSDAGSRGGRALPQVLRAMENLRNALRYRLREGPLGEAEMRAIVEALDEAARKVEQR